MATALQGRTLCYQLNRLAGTLVNGVPQLDEQGAANKWAGLTSKASLDLVGALNKVAGRTTPSTWLGLRAVCNLIGGTVDQDPAYALAQLP